MQTTALPNFDIAKTLQNTAKHPLLARLVKEISDDLVCQKYDRTHNRHNRGK